MYKSVRCLGGMVLAACVALLYGCMAVPGGQPPSRDPKYDWGFYNATDRTYRAVQVGYIAEGGVRVTPHAGYLSPGVYKLWAFGAAPIPPKAVVSWETLDGQAHEREVEVASKVPDLDRFTGTIYLYFAGGAVEVIPMTSAEEEGEAAKGVGASLAARSGTTGAKRLASP